MYVEDLEKKAKADKRKQKTEIEFNPSHSALISTPCSRLLLMSLFK